MSLDHGSLSFMFLKIAELNQDFTHNSESAVHSNVEVLILKEYFLLMFNST